MRIISCTVGMNIIRRNYLHILLCVSGLTLIAGCSTYHNVTAYFNTYYNAKKVFSEAVREVEKAPQKDRDTNYFRPYVIPKNVASKFEKVIEKCSKVIQLYPESSYLDESLVMIGQSYVYRGETESAIRKFREFLENFPSSSLRYESKLWLAIALYQSGKQDESLLTLQEFIPEATEAEKENMVLLGMMLNAQIMLDRENYEDAIAIYEKGMGISADDDLLSRLHYSRAQCYERMNRPREAAEAYSKVPEYTKVFAREFQARMQSGRSLVLAGDYDAAFKTFSDLSKEKLKPDERGLIELERAKTYMVAGDTVKAFELFETIDSTYKRTDAAAKAYYERGVMYDEVYLDYPRAKFYFEKAKTEFSASEIAPLAQKKLNTFIQYFKIHDNLDKNDSLLLVALTPDSLLKSADTSDVDSLSDDMMDPETDSLMESVDIEKPPGLKITEQKEITPKSGERPAATAQKSDTLTGRDSVKISGDKIVKSDVLKQADSLIAVTDTAKKTAVAAMEQAVKTPLTDSTGTASLKKPKSVSGQDSIILSGKEAAKADILTKADSLVSMKDTVLKVKDAAKNQSAKPAIADSSGIASIRKTDSLTGPDSVKNPGGKIETREVRLPGDSLLAKTDTTKDIKQGSPKQLTQSVFPDSVVKTLSQKSDTLSGQDSVKIPSLKIPGDSLIAKSDTTKKGKAAPKPAKQALSPDSIRAILAKNKYELASLFYLQINYIDSAEVWYQRLIDEHPKSEYIPRSLYALSEIKRSRGDTVAVDSIYTLILSQYDSTEYARMVKINLGMVVDSTALDSAQTSFRMAESLLMAGDTAGALRGYSGVAAKYHTSPVAAKSLYTIGWILENYYSLNDSAYFWYKRLMKEYPASVYAAEVKGKVSVKENPEKVSEFVKINEIKVVPMPAKKGRSLRQGVTRQEDEEAGDQNPNSRLNRRAAQQDDEEEEEVDPDAEEEEVDPDAEEEEVDEDDDPGYYGRGASLSRTMQSIHPL